MNTALRKLIDGTTAATLVDGAIEPQAVLSAIRGSLVDLDLLAEEHRLSKPDTYTRHLLHADPNGLFSILALVWGPGQGSPVHGHPAPPETTQVRSRLLLVGRRNQRQHPSR